MTVRKRRSDRSGRGALPSPGRPCVARREDHRQFWAAIAAGRSSEDAAVGAGVSPAVGARWFRRAGGMPPSHLAPSAKPLSGRYLTYAEREEIAIWHAQRHGVREIARRHEGGTGFDMARAALGSTVERHDRSVYDLEPSELGTFDFVFLGSVLVHLKSPIAALERVRAICAAGATFIVIDAIDHEFTLLMRSRPVARSTGSRSTGPHGA